IAITAAVIIRRRSGSPYGCSKRWSAISRLSSAAPDDLPKQSTPRRREPERARPFVLRRAGIARDLAGFAGRLPHDRRGRRGALRRQGGRPQEARLVLFPED